MTGGSGELGVVNLSEWSGEASREGESVWTPEGGTGVNTASGVGQCLGKLFFPGLLVWCVLLLSRSCLPGASTEGWVLSMRAEGPRLVA
jgi:hypothetical protein